MVSFAVFIVILRSTVQSKIMQSGLNHEYETVSVGNFQKLDFSSHVIVRIKQGKECKVEYFSDTDSVNNPGLENINGTLRFNVDPAIEKENSGNIHFRITMPVLQEIKAARGTEINLNFFQSDSLSVFLGNGCVFKGNNNTLKHVSFKTSGDARLEITSTI